MTSPASPPADDKDCIELEKTEDHVSDGMLLFTSYLIQQKAALTKLLLETTRIEVRKMKLS